MGLISRLGRAFNPRNWFRGGLKKSFGVPDLGGGYGNYDPKPRVRNTEKWLEAFNSNSRIRGPVNRIATDFSALKWRLYRRGALREDGKHDRELVADHPALRVWNHPNPMMTGVQFRKLGVIYLSMAGRFPVWIQRDENGLPLFLWPIRPFDIKRMPSRRNFYWEFTLNGQKHREPPQDLIWITRIDPSSPYGWGVGEAEAVAHEVAQDEYASLWNSNFFRQGAHLGKIVVIPGLSDKTGERLKADFDSKYSGIHNSHKTFFIGATGKPEVSDLSPKHIDLDFNEGRRLLRDTIAQNWGVPPECLGIVENSNRATAEAAMAIHQHMNLKPVATEFEEHFNLQFVALYGDENLFLECENPVQATKDFILSQTSEGLKAGAIMVNEWRAANNWPQQQGMDVYRVPVNMATVDENGLPIPMPDKFDTNDDPDLETLALLLDLVGKLKKRGGSK